MALRHFASVSLQVIGVLCRPCRSPIRVFGPQSEQWACASRGPTSRVFYRCFLMTTIRASPRKVRSNLCLDIQGHAMRGCRQWMMDGSRADFGSEWTGLLLNQIIRHAKKDKASEMQSLECTTTQISPSCERCSILVGIVLVDTTELRLAGTGCID